MYKAIELNKEFNTKEELFKAILENEDLILGAKKSVIYKSIDKGLQIVTNQNEVNKFLNQEIKGIKMDENYYYFVVNSSNILDSHNDMHVEGNWNQTVKSKQGKNYLVWEHKLDRNNIIAVPKDIEIITAKIPFSLLGKNYDGESYCLIYKVAKDKIIDKQAKEFLEQGIDLQASVRMQYVKLETAINSNDLEYSKQKATFDTYYPQIANKGDFKEIDYFFVVKEAKNEMESSLVLFGSNGATGLIQSEQSKDTQTEIKEEQVNPTQEKKKPILIF